MSVLRVEYRAGGVHLPGLGLWLDPHEAQSGAERVFISHAHSDHIAPHREVIVSEPTARLLKVRLPGKRAEHVLRFGDRARLRHGPTEFVITLLPAGHILGSAMLLIEAADETLLYTGDFKLRPGRSAERCDPRPADVLVMETTFGRPEYVFPPTSAVLEGVVRFCREALDNDQTPVLLGYSLGKSQEILSSLAEAGLPLMLHGTVRQLTRIYEDMGQVFPPYEPFEANRAHGKVLICPPTAARSAMLRGPGKSRTAVLTGWAVDPNCRYRYQCDAAFALSDHADFPDLLALVDRVQPRKVYTVHGFAADFAQALRARGYNAQALSEHEQLSLGLALTAAQTKPDRFSSHGAERPSARRGSMTTSPTHSSGERPQPGAESFTRFAETCGAISRNSRKLEKVRLLADYLRTLPPAAVEIAATWFSGRPFPAWQNKVLQTGWALLREALAAVAGIDARAFHQVYLKHSDLGETAGELLEHYTPSIPLELEEVDSLFASLHAARGPLTKTPFLREAFARCTPLEAKYLVKIITGDLRIGLKEGLVEDAIAAAFAAKAESVRQATLLVGDVGRAARLAAENRLADATLVPFRPVKFMLASAEETARAIWDRMRFRPHSVTPAPDDDKGGDAGLSPRTDPAQDANAPFFVWVEDKYDGIRCQVHKAGQRVALYSRDLKDITAAFLELADVLRGAPADFVLDGEIVAMRGERVLPFAELQKRLGRRQGDLFMREEVPIRYVAFDLLWLDGASYLDRPLRERRGCLESLAGAHHGLLLARVTRAGSAEEIEKAFSAARSRENEGLMVKDPGSAYSPGRRGLAWLKLKKAYATLDCVVVGAEYGHGKRSKVLSDYTFAVRDEHAGQLKTIGKAYSGLTDAEIASLTAHFLRTAIRQQGRYFEVPPDTVLEIAFDKIQPSTRHNSGLAMRFPRIVRIRADKPVTEIDTLDTARRLAAS